MNPELIAYPWKADLERDKQDLIRQIENLRLEVSNMQNTVNNLKHFSQELYDRLNIGMSNYNSSPINKPY